MLDHARNALEREREHLRLEDGAEGAIEDEIALISDEGRVPHPWPQPDLAMAPRLEGDGLNQAHGREQSEADDLDGKWKRAERLHHLALIGDDHHPVGGG